MGTAASPLAVQRVIWAMIGGAMVGQLGLVPALVPPVAEIAWLGLPLAVAALACVIPGFWLARRSGSTQRIVGLATLDTAATLGVVIHLLGGGACAVGVAGGPALLAWLLCWPQETGVVLSPSHEDLLLPPPII
jgi:hypothetical protein